MVTVTGPGNKGNTIMLGVLKVKQDISERDIFCLFISRA